MADEQQERKARYDAECKRVLSEKGILAQILKDCTEEFKDCSLEDIVEKYILGSPEVGTVTVMPSETCVESKHTEDKSATEGTVFFDIRFDAAAPVDGRLIRLIINVEAQNDFHPGYALLKRAMYYGCRMISSQYGTVFVRSEYDKIQKVYTIWVCMEPAREWAYTITRYHMQEENIVGHARAPKEDYDLISPILVCLGKKNYQELQGVLRMLNLLFIDQMGKEEKVMTLKRDFGIRTTPKLEKGVAEMCNLSEGIERRGIERGRAEGRMEGREEGRMEGRAEGREEGRAEGRVGTLISLVKKNLLSLADAAREAGLSVEEFKKMAML